MSHYSPATKNDVKIQSQFARFFGAAALMLPYDSLIIRHGLRSLINVGTRILMLVANQGKPTYAEKILFS